MKLVLEYTFEDGGEGIAKFTIPDISLPIDEYIRRLGLFTDTLDLFNAELKKRNAKIVRRMENDT